MGGFCRETCGAWDGDFHSFLREFRDGSFGGFKFCFILYHFELAKNRSCKYSSTTGSVVSAKTISAVLGKGIRVSASFRSSRSYFLIQLFEFPNYGTKRERMASPRVQTLELRANPVIASLAALLVPCAANFDAPV